MDRDSIYLKASKEQANLSFLCRGMTSETTTEVCNYAVNMPIIWLKKKKSVFLFFFFIEERRYVQIGIKLQ